MLTSLLVVVLLGQPAPANGPFPGPTPVPVGRTATLASVVLPGTELETVPITDRKIPVVLRIVSTAPHGSDLRYDLEYYGLEAGTFDLTKLLQRKDRTPAVLPKLEVTIQSQLPPGQIQPEKLTLDPAPRLGGYRLLQIGLGIAWAFGFLGILYFGFLRSKRRAEQQFAAPPKTLAEQLEPLIEGAVAGKLAPAELAHLERTLLAFWRKRLGLVNLPADESMQLLRANDQAGPLLNQLEAWLHRPTPT
ncbi:MAG: hypothetical protein ACRCZF_26780, partial [Gemmataceae bacterium]